MADTRRLVLRILLGSLGATALAGIGAVLIESEIVGRTAGSAFATSVIALLILGLLARFEKPQFQSSALLGIISLGIVWLITLALIWEFDNWFGGSSDLEWKLWVTIWFVFLGGCVGMVYLRLWHWPFTRIAATAGLVITALSFVLLMIGTWISRRFFSEEKWGLSASALIGISLPAVISLVGLNVPVGEFAGSAAAPKGSLRHWRWIGVAGGAVGTVMALVGIWFDIHSDGKAFAAVIGAGAIAAFAHLVLLAPLKGQQQWLGLATLISGAMLLALIETAVWMEYSEQIIGRAMSAAMIATTCGSLALIIVARLNRRVEFAVVDSSQYLRVALQCPRCHRKQELPLGGAACEGCGLKIEVKVEEPRCTQCGYLLYMLKGDRCPECGAAIDAGGRSSPA